MSQREINFLHQNKSLLESRDQSDKKSFFFIAIFTTIVVLIFIALLVVENYYKKKLAALANEQQRIEQALLDGDKQERRYLSFHSKLQKTDEILTKQTHGTQSLIQTFEYFTTQNVAIRKSIYDYYLTSIELTLTCNSVFSLKELFALVQAEEFRQQYQQVELLSLSRSGDGTYTLDVDLKL